jgi:hypothetical protein
MNDEMGDVKLHRMKREKRRCDIEVREGGKIKLYPNPALPPLTIIRATKSRWQHHVLDPGSPNSAKNK